MNTQYTWNLYYNKAYRFKGDLFSIIREDADKKVHKGKIILIYNVRFDNPYTMYSYFIISQYFEEMCNYEDFEMLSPIFSSRRQCSRWWIKHCRKNNIENPWKDYCVYCY